MDGVQIAHSDLSSQANIEARQPVCKELICKLSHLDLQQTARPKPGGGGAPQEPATLLAGAEHQSVFSSINTGQKREQEKKRARK